MVSEIAFNIIENSGCLLYRFGDEFKLSGDILALPHDRLVCLVLAEDIRKVVRNKHIEGTYGTFRCSGCSGSIRLEYGGEKERKHDQPCIDAIDIDTIASLLTDFSFFESLDEDDIRLLVSYLELRKFNKGEIVIKKGDPGNRLFIIIFGKVEVLGDYGISIAFMGKGEVFGEMSLLSGDPVNATIKVVEPATILYIKGKDFRNVLTKFPSLQMYFARLLAQRIAERNLVKIKEISPGMVGQLSDMPPSELFQAFNVNQKTGRLNLNLSKGNGIAAFREGELVRAEYDDKEGKEAFYDMLKETEGRFRFSSGLSDEDIKAEVIGDFMWLLMEGVRRMDEEEDEAGK